MNTKKLVAALFFVLTAVSLGARQEPPFHKLHWLAGAWSRTNNKPGQSGTETWSMTGKRLIGKGITLRGTDTLFVESLSIVNKGGSLHYVADVTGNKGPVYFKFTAMTATSFRCENAENEFPKAIVYSYEGNGRLKAVVSGGGKSVEYFFVKK